MCVKSFNGMECLVHSIHIIVHVEMEMILENKIIKVEHLYIHVEVTAQEDTRQRGESTRLQRKGI